MPYAKKVTFTNRKNSDVFVKKDSNLWAEIKPMILLVIATVPNIGLKIQFYILLG